MIWPHFRKLNLWWDSLILALALWKVKRREVLFREWVEQQVGKDKILKAVRDKSDEFPVHLIQFISTALHISPGHLERLPWQVIIKAFYLLLAKHPIINLPIVSAYVDSVSKDDWDYDGRTWHLYSHLLAKHYGWTLEYISQLQVVEALAKIQEILTDEQLDREFFHGHSELAYTYDSGSKKSTFVPLPRPPWMHKPIQPTRKLVFPKGSLPLGNVNNDAVPEADKPKELIHQ